MKSLAWLGQRKEASRFRPSSKLSGFEGVHWVECLKGWVAINTVNYETFTKYFSAERLGEKEALRRAVAWKEEQRSLLE